MRKQWAVTYQHKSLDKSLRTDIHLTSTTRLQISFGIRHHPSHLHNNSLLDCQSLTKSQAGSLFQFFLFNLPQQGYAVIQIKVKALFYWHYCFHVIVMHVKDRYGWGNTTDISNKQLNIRPFYRKKTNTGTWCSLNTIITSRYLSTYTPEATENPLSLSKKLDERKNEFVLPVWLLQVHREFTALQREARMPKKQLFCIFIQRVCWDWVWHYQHAVVRPIWFFCLHQW